MDSFHALALPLTDTIDGKINSEENSDAEKMQISPAAAENSTLKNSEKDKNNSNNNNTNITSTQSSPNISWNSFALDSSSSRSLIALQWREKSEQTPEHSRSNRKCHFENLRSLKGVKIISPSAEEEEG